MNKHFYKHILTGFIVVLAGCQPSSPLQLDTSNIQPSVNYDNLGKILDRAVTDKGQIIPALLAQNASTLQDQLKLLAVTGPTIIPELFPEEDSRIAYWYNARTAWAIMIAMECNCPKKIVREELMRREFPLDGRLLSLEKIDHILKQFPDWRIVIAAPGVTLHRAQLPSRPFTGENIQEQIDQRFNAFIDDRTRFVIDVSSRQIRIPEILWPYRKPLIEKYERQYQTVGTNFTTALLPYVKGPALRRLQDAIGYQCVQSRGGSPPLALFE
jgi:hypothetical protein